MSKQKINLGSIAHFLRDGRLLSQMMGIQDPRFETLWYPVPFTMSYVNTVYVLDLLREEYCATPTEFFTWYGCPIGIYNLMHDLRECDFPESPTTDKIYPLISRGERLSRLLEIEDERFLTHWKPRYLMLNDRQIDEIIDFLQTVYVDDRDYFFSRYGTSIGVMNLEHDLTQEIGHTFSTVQLGTVINDPECMQLFLNIQDDRFSTDWKPRAIQGRKGMPQKIATVLRQQYDEDPLRFFIRYGCEAGQYFLLKDLQKRNIAVPPVQLNALVKHSSVLSQLTGIPEKEFQGRWNGQPIYLSSSQLERTVDFLTEKYHADPEQFFERFGNNAAIFYLTDKLRKDKTISPNMSNLTRTLKNGSFISTILGISDERFKTEWNIGGIFTSQRQMRAISSFLKNVYFADPAAFLQRYKTKAGAYTLACDLQENKMILDKSLRFFADFLRRENLEAILGEDMPSVDDVRPQALGEFSFLDLRLIFEHLKTNFQSDPSLFFRRYGSEFGSLILASESSCLLKRNFRVDHLSHILSDADFISSILQSEDERFQSAWCKRRYLASLGSGRNNRDLDQLFGQSITRMHTDCSLPEKIICESDRDYLRVRYGFRFTDIDTVLHFVYLYDKGKVRDIERNISSAVEADRRKISQLPSSLEKVDEFALTQLAGNLLYSFAPEIRKQTQERLVTLYTPFYQQLSKHDTDGRAWNAFIDYCLKFDLFNLKGSPRREPFCIKKGIASQINNALSSQKDRMISLDQEIFEGDSTLHEVIG